MLNNPRRRGRNTPTFILMDVKEELLKKFMQKCIKNTNIYLWSVANRIFAREEQQLF